MKLIILNLPRDFTEDQLAKMFKTYGNIRSCDLVMDGRTGKSKGFGFIEMAVGQQGLEAIEDLHGSKVDRKTIRVKAAD